MLQRHELLGVEHRLDVDLEIARRRRDDALFLLARRIADGELHHEPVELRFGQRIRALLLDRVLRREHEERLGQAGASVPPPSPRAPASPAAAPPASSAARG